MSISNIDDLLMSAHTNTQPATPEHQEDVPDEIEEIEQEEPEVAEEPEEVEAPESNEDEPEEKPKVSKKEYDEYGNEKNVVIRDRLKQQAESMTRKHQEEINELRAQLAELGASKQVQQAAKDFEYNPDESGDWQQQLASFVKQTVNSMQSEKDTQKRQQEEYQAQTEFRDKFSAGMNRFDDFVEVVNQNTIDDAMTMALRGMSDPAAFIYAASKRNPEELQRISKLRDPYARIVEMGKLEERMRKNKPTTKAPRPLGSVKEDTTQKVVKKEVDRTGDDLLAKADAKRLSVVRTRHKGNR